MPDLLIWPALVLLGIVVGAYGSMIGAGGGFVLVPVLLLLYPSEEPELLTSISLVVVFFNALSGTAAYLRQQRVDFLAGSIFAVATVPGAIAGALLVAVIPRSLFDLLFGAVLLILAIFLQVPRNRIGRRRHRRGEVTRSLKDSHGDTYLFSYSLPIGIAFSLIVGFLSSLLGIGGGVMHVPLMVEVLRFPTHIATATSQFILTITSFSGSAVHAVNGDIYDGYRRMASLSLGVVIGAQLGALLSARLTGSATVRLLSIALMAVAVRLLLTLWL